MARKAKYDWGKTSSSKYQKFETRVTVKADVQSNDQDSAYIDTAQCLSLVNRKLVRQGHVFRISGMKLWSSDNDSDDIDFTVAALPRTWVMFNAYKKARSLWNQMNLEAIDSLGTGNLPKYYDFKVLMDGEHFTNQILQTGSNTTNEVDMHDNLLPCDADGNVVSGTGDWVYSAFETSDASASKFYAHMCGTHMDASGSAEGSSGRDMPNDGGSAGLILAYQQSRGAAFTSQDLAGLSQNVDADSPWAKLFHADDQDQQVLADLAADNDGPPYPADYPGGIDMGEGVLVGSGYIQGGANRKGTGLTIPSFEAPLGLIKLDFNRTGDSDDVSSPDAFVSFNAQIIGAC